MGIFYYSLEDAMLKIAQDGTYLFEPCLHIFESVADEQQLFKSTPTRKCARRWCALEDIVSACFDCYLSHFRRPLLSQVRSPDGKDSFSKDESVLAERPATPAISRRRRQRLTRLR
eukprot:5689072-Pleurochrysis_carterae.AAC.1